MSIQSVNAPTAMDSDTGHASATISLMVRCWLGEYPRQGAAQWTTCSGLDSRSSALSGKSRPTKRPATNLPYWTVTGWS